MEFRSNEIMHGRGSPFYRSLFKSMGYSDYELDHRPLIRITNTRSACVPGYFNLNQVNEFVKKGVCSTDGTAVEFGTTGCCDGVAQGHTGMNYILPLRGIICNSIKVMVQAHRFDGAVLLASCDKTVPSTLMAATRPDAPVTICVDSPMLGGVEFNGRKSDLTSIDETKGMTRSRRITEDEYHPLENMACPRRGSCSFLGTANSMCCASETVGMSLPGSASIPAPYGERLKSSFETGRAVVNLVMNNVTAKQVVAKKSICSTIKVTMAICGSTNTVLHIAAIANEVKLDMNVMGEFRALNLTTPQIAKANPAAKWDIEASYRTDGIPRVIDRLGNIIDRDTATCAGKSVDENLKDQVYWYPESREIIKTVDESFSRAGGVAVLSGSLAPDTTVSKPGVIDPALRRFIGKARCYNSEEEAESAILGDKIQKGEVVVIRYEGPKGGPGMEEMFKAMKYMYGTGLAKDTVLIMDGRFSGTNDGCFVGHISPEATEGDPLALMKDGDEIMVDMAEGKLELHVSDEIINARRKHWIKPEKEIPNGYSKLYSKVVSSADKGAIIQC